MIPSRYPEFCKALGVNPYHPNEWTADQRAAFSAWRLVRFRARWRFRRDSGDIALRYAAGQRAQVLLDVRRDLAAALSPAPARNIYRICPCHRQRFVSSEITPTPEEYVDDEDLAVWRAGDRMARMGLSKKLATALAYLDTFKPKEPIAS